jgi:hypothetical protein
MHPGGSEGNMKLVCDEIDLDILERAISTPGVRLRALYASLIGLRKETFYWARCQVLISNNYLERRKVGPGRIYPTEKSRKRVIEDW